MNNKLSFKGKVTQSLLAFLALTGGNFSLVKQANAETFNFGGATLVQQEVDSKPMTIEEYAQGVNDSINYARNYINYDHLPQDMQCLYYLANINYIPVEVKQELIANGIVYDFNMNTGEGVELLQNAYNLINVIADFNQSQIREEKNTMPESIINVAHFCHDEHDAKLVNDIHNNYFYAYKNGRFRNDYFTQVFKQLTTLNAAEHAGNAFELSVGANWLTENVIGGGVMQLLRDDLQADYTFNELIQYFDEAELNKAQWILKEHYDKPMDLNCLDDLQDEVFKFGQLWKFVYDNVNNDMFKELEGVHNCMCGVDVSKCK